MPGLAPRAPGAAPAPLTCPEDEKCWAVPCPHHRAHVLVLLPLSFPCLFVPFILASSQGRIAFGIQCSVRLAAEEGDGTATGSIIFVGQTLHVL